MDNDSSKPILRPMSSKIDPDEHIPTVKLEAKTEVTSEHLQEVGVGSSHTGAKVSNPTIAPSKPTLVTSMLPVKSSQINASKYKSRSLFYVLTILLIVVIAGGLLFAYRTMQNIDVPSDINVSNAEDGTPTNTPTSLVRVISPKANDSVEGFINVEGTASSEIKKIKVELTDYNGYLIARTDTELVVLGSQTVGRWEANLSVDVSPTDSLAQIKITPDDRVAGAIVVPVMLKSSTDEKSERIKLIAPVQNQLMSGTNVTFIGEMKGFFEGNMGIKLESEQNEVLFTSSVQADADNYEDFAAFEKLIDFKSLPSNIGNKGKWVVYETSSLNGEELVILEVPIRFPNSEVIIKD